MREKAKKIREMNEKEIKLYAYSFNQKNKISELLSQKIYSNKKYSIAGRIVSLRTHGKILFGNLQDLSGNIQFSMKHDDSPLKYKEFSKYIERGDIIGIEGSLFKTKRGEKTILIKKYSLLAKSLRPLPDKWHGISDVEERFRQRYVDLIMNKESRDLAIMRSKMLTSVREFLDNNEFLEVETPVLQPIYGGAAAKPFETQHNGLKKKMYLRIADELYLKRLIVAGLERVYEVCKDFRNEGIDTKHNPEFTMIEFYQAYVDYNYMMKFVEKLIRYIVKKVLGKLIIDINGKKLDFKKKFDVVSMVDEVTRVVGKDVTKMNDAELTMLAKTHGIDEKVPGKIIEEIFGHKIESKLWNPTFVIDFPIDITPLAKRKRGRPEVAERFELFLNGREVANSYSELNDPMEQFKRFKEQVEHKKKKGDEEAHPMDKDFIRAMEYGMPPMGGVGIGFDRFLTAITNKSIKENILFPMLAGDEKITLFSEKFEKRL